MKDSSVIILGAVPPPIGGVTMHVLRLISGLESLGFDFKFINLRLKTSNNKFDKKKYIHNILRIFKSKKTEVIHYQLNNIFELTLIVIISIIKKCRIITSVHSFRTESFSKIKNILIQLITKTRTEFIAPSETIKEALISKGVKQNKIRVLHTFLPPSELEINEKLPDEVIKFLKNKSNIIVANAYKLYLDDFGVDVYGLDMCIEACKVIPETNFIFCMPLISDQNYYNECTNRIEEYMIKDRFLIVNRNISLVSLFKHADLFIRPTSTDSFGVSVAEAIYMGVPAIASDVCDRPDGAILFKSRNLNDFINKISGTLTNHHTEFKSNINGLSVFKKYLDIYESGN